MSNKHDLPPLPDPDERTRKGCAFSAFAMHDYAIAAIQRLEAENEALRKDAERYRWLRGDCGPHSVRWPRFEVKYWTGRWWDDLRLAQMDAAIDDAMTKEQKE